MVKVGTRCNPGYREASFERHFRQRVALCLFGSRLASSSTEQMEDRVWRVVQALSSLTSVLPHTCPCRRMQALRQRFQQHFQRRDQLLRAPPLPPRSSANSRAVSPATSSTRSSRPGFRSRTDGAYDDCSLTLTDSSNNRSLPLKISSFVVAESSSISLNHGVGYVF